MRLELELDDRAFGPGDTIAGRVRVAEGGASRSLRVELRFVEKSPDYETEVRSVGSVLHTGELSDGGSFAFALTVPSDGLPNVATDNAELYWELDARSDEPLRDSHARRRVEITAR